MDPSLREVAGTGDTDALYALIRKDPNMLEHIDQIPFIDTPLHIAANEGQIKFAMEMINLKPSFGRKLNQDGFSPMHLAFKMGHTKLVLRLLQTDKDLVRVKGREGMTPFHCAAAAGNSNLLFQFLETCPECVEDVTVRNETALHLALKNDHTDAFNFLLGWLRKNRRGGGKDLERKVMNWRDDDDNTALHIAATKQQHQAVQLLLDSFYGLDANAKNSEGLTAREIIERVERQGLNMSGAEDDDTTTAKIERIKKRTSRSERALVKLIRARNGLSENMLNATLVVAALVITAIYQSSLSPPRGLWQGDNTSIPTTTSNLTTTTKFKLFNDNYSEYRFKFLLGEETRKTGTAVMNPNLFLGFWFFNFIAFGLPVLLTVLLLSNVPSILLIPLYYLSVSYFNCMTIVSPSTFWANLNFVVMWTAILLPLLLVVRSVWLSKQPKYREIRQLRRLFRK
ncbi:ankyrin repeat-containing protein BDA1 isoform X2 [Gossypium raimondii]|uniref:ankyrin repeat-containing protein BDA1 isoform X2 n=1 Tax=Gossypium raimondii TaxID=29730 RepID=UPI00227D6B7A|nr:ankyrin repeat-containing protein BDA1 isoform X2 [Gossypium raimondii]